MERSELEVPALGAPAPRDEKFREAFQTELEAAGLELDANWTEVFMAFYRALANSGISEIPVERDA